METRLRGKRKCDREDILGRALKKTKRHIDSLGEEEQDWEIPFEYSKELSMAENAEAVREVGRLMADVMNQQIEMQQRREEANIERFSELLERQERSLEFPWSQVMGPVLGLVGRGFHLVR